MTTLSRHLRRRPGHSKTRMPCWRPRTERTDGHVGANIEAVCREAAQTAVREHVRATADCDDSAVDDIVVTMAHFEQALDEVGISTDQDTMDTGLAAAPV